MAAEAVDSSSAILAVLGDGRLSPDSGSLALASHHRLELLLFDSLLRSERISTRTRAAAVAALERAGRDNTRLFDDLQSVISILADAGVPTLPLKGPALALDRKRVGSGKSVSVLVDLGGRRVLKKKKKTR